MKGRVLLAGLATLLALIGTTAVFLYVNRADARAVEGQESVEVYYATSAIATGTTATAAEEQGLMKREIFARRAVPEGALLALSPELEKQVALADIPAGQIVMRAAFGDQVTLDSALAIPGDKMAMSIEVEDPARVSGLIRVGSEISILMTGEVEKKILNGKKMEVFDKFHLTRILLPRVQVLAVGLATTKGVTTNKSVNESGNEDTNADDSSEPSALVTVAVDQAQAEKLAYGISQGELYFALLTPQSKVKAGPGVDSYSILKY